MWAVRVHGTHFNGRQLSGLNTISTVGWVGVFFWGGGLMHGIKIPQQDFALKTQGGLMHERGAFAGHYSNCGTKWPWGVGVFSVCWFCHSASQSSKCACVEHGQTLCAYIKLTFRLHHAWHSCSVFTALLCSFSVVKRTIYLHRVFLDLTCAHNTVQFRHYLYCCADWSIPWSGEDRWVSPLRWGLVKVEGKFYDITTIEDGKWSF